MTQEPTDERLKPQDYTLERAKRYLVKNRITGLEGQASAFSADEACRKLGWMIGDCFVKELSNNG